MSNNEDVKEAAKSRYVPVLTCSPSLFVHNEHCFVHALKMPHAFCTIVFNFSHFLISVLVNSSNLVADCFIDYVAAPKTDTYKYSAKALMVGASMRK